MSSLRGSRRVEPHCRSAERARNLKFLRNGGTLLVCQLVRMGGMKRIVIEAIHDLERRGVNIESLIRPVIDLTTLVG